MSYADEHGNATSAVVVERIGSCRRCPVACDMVVYPIGCVESGCGRLYAYEDGGRRFVGCLEKVFRVELDLELFLAAQQARGGFGGLRAQREPLPICRTAIEQTYPHRAEGACVNPDFLLSAPRPEFVVTVNRPPVTEDGPVDP